MGRADVVRQAVPKSDDRTKRCEVRIQRPISSKDIVMFNVLQIPSPSSVVNWIFFSKLIIANILLVASVEFEQRSVDANMVKQLCYFVQVHSIIAVSFNKQCGVCIIRRINLFTYWYFCKTNMPEIVYSGVMGNSY